MTPPTEESSVDTAPAMTDAPAITDAPSRPVAGPERRRWRSRPARPPTVVLAVVGALVVGIVVRFWLDSELWLDEALTVNIAKLPLAQLPEALRHDGAPPLYYLLLHGWIGLVGDGNAEVRALGGLLAVACLPLMWLAGRRLAGPHCAWAALLLLAASPFAVHYATEARMYSLSILLVLLGFLTLSATLERPAALPVVGLGLVSGLLALTHYWSFFLIGATLAVLAARAWLIRGTARRHCLVCMAAIAAGGVLFIPWLRSFVFQLRHTGAPWAPPRPLVGMFDTLGDFTGGGTGAARMLLVLSLLMATLGLLGRAVDGRLELDLRTRPAGRGLALVSVLTLVAGLGTGLLMGSAYAYRYASVALVPFLLLVALGVSLLADGRVRHGVLAVMVVLGLVGGIRETQQRRTQAGVNAAAINALGGDGDVVAFCPDQLGPSTNRLLDRRFDQLSFPNATSPRFVDWVDYKSRHAGANPTRFAEMLDTRAGDAHDVWLVWEPGYRTLKNFCEIVDRDLGDMRPLAEVVRIRRPTRYGEAAWLLRYPARCRVPLDRADEPVRRRGGRLPREAVFTRPPTGGCGETVTTSSGRRAARG